MKNRETQSSGGIGIVLLIIGAVLLVSILPDVW